MVYEIRNIVEQNRRGISSQNGIYETSVECTFSQNKYKILDRKINISIPAVLPHLLLFMETTWPCPRNKKCYIWNDEQRPIAYSRIMDVVGIIRLMRQFQTSFKSYTKFLWVRSSAVLLHTLICHYAQNVIDVTVHCRPSTYWWIFRFYKEVGWPSSVLWVVLHVDRDW